MAVTCDSYAPFDAGPGANVYEAGWQTMMRRIGPPGVIPGTLSSWQVYADSTGLQVKVRAGEGWAEGFWGTTSTEKILPIASAHATLARKDLVVWRVDTTNNRIELDVLTGTPASLPGEPALTRNSTIYESPLAVVDVPAADTSIDAAQVLDVRWYGGDKAPTLPDDFALFGDQISTVQRNNVTVLTVCPNGNAFLTLTQALRNATVSNIRYYLDVARVGGASDLRVYLGYSRHRLVDVTGNIGPTDSTNAGRVHVDALPSSLSIAAGQFVAIGYLATGATTGATLGASSPTAGTGGGIAEILNPSVTALDPLGRWSTIYKASQSVLPSAPQVHVEANWTKRDRSFWFALG